MPGAVRVIDPGRFHGLSRYKLDDFERLPDHGCPIRTVFCRIISMLQTTFNEFCLYQPNAGLDHLSYFAGLPRLLPIWTTASPRAENSLPHLPAASLKSDSVIFCV